MEKIKIALVDDHQLVLDGIKSLLEDEDSIDVIAEGNNGLEAIEIVNNQQPDLLIIDIRMPVMNGIEAIKKLQTSTAKTKKLVLSMHDSEEYVLQSIEAGADGYLLKGASKIEFLKAIQTIAEGNTYFAGEISNIILKKYVKGDNHKETNPIAKYNLTKRETQILKLVLQGLSNKEIGENLSISRRTAEVHRFNLMKKLDVKNLMDLAHKAQEENLI